MTTTTILALDLGNRRLYAVALFTEANNAEDCPPSASVWHWREISGWPDYEVSSQGDVRRTTPGFSTYPGKVLKPILNKTTGYFAVCLSNCRRKKRTDIHRLVALTFLGPQSSPSHLVAHYDGVRTNNCVTNLRWATQRENLSDMHRHGTALVGSANPMSKLDEIDCEAIRRMKKLGIPRLVIAAGYGVHVRTVFRVLASGIGRGKQ